jgi:hypothetical protein
MDCSYAPSTLPACGMIIITFIIVNNKPVFVQCQTLLIAWHFLLPLLSHRALCRCDGGGFVPNMSDSRFGDSLITPMTNAGLLRQHRDGGIFWAVFLSCEIFNKW